MKPEHQFRLFSLAVLGLAALVVLPEKSPSTSKAMASNPVQIHLTEAQPEASKSQKIVKIEKSAAQATN